MPPFQSGVGSSAPVSGVGRCRTTQKSVEMGRSAGTAAVTSGWSDSIRDRPCPSTLVTTRRAPRAVVAARTELDCFGAVAPTRRANSAPHAAISVRANPRRDGGNDSSEVITSPPLLMTCTVWRSVREMVLGPDDYIAVMFRRATTPERAFGSHSLPNECCPAFRTTLPPLCP